MRHPSLEVHPSGDAPLRNRTVDLLLTMSIPGRNSTAAMLVKTGFVVVLVLVNVPGFRPVLARGWHDQLGRCMAYSRQGR